MTALVEQRSSPNLPSYLTPAVDHELRVCVSRLIPPISASLNRYSIEAFDAPSGSTRQALSIRRDNLDRWLQPAGMTEANKAYNGLVASMATATVDDETAVREMQGFIEATARLPLFALTAACTAFRNGVIGDGKWMPKPGQICIEAGKRVADLAKERREIHAVLTAEVKALRPDNDLRARNLSDAAALVAEGRSMAAASRTGKLTPEQIAEQKITAHAHDLMLKHGRPDPRPMPPLSPYLRHKLGLGDSDMVPDIASEDAA